MPKAEFDMCGNPGEILGAVGRFTERSRHHRGALDRSHALALNISHD
jgi:hypothetical protein